MINTKPILDQIAKPSADSFDDGRADDLANLVEGIYLVLEERVENEEVLGVKDMECMVEDISQWIISQEESNGIIS